MGGLELQRQLNAMESPLPIVFITAHYDEMNQKQASEAGAVDFLRKPFDANTLMAAVQRGLE
jgi:FixJ family two-component response regulator